MLAPACAQKHTCVCVSGCLGVGVSVCLCVSMSVCVIASTKQSTAADEVLETLCMELISEQYLTTFSSSLNSHSNFVTA
jgi:hypothetical protein